MITIISMLRGIAMTLYPLPVEIRSYQIHKPRLNVIFPQVDDKKHGHAAAQINRVIYRKVLELIRLTGYEENETTEVQGSYEIKLNERELLSLTLTVYGYKKGAAHGMTYQRGLTFEVKSGHLYTLAELFRPDAPYVAFLSKDVARQIQEREIPTLEPFTAIAPDQPFYLTDKSLVLFYDLYQLAAYVYGFVYFPISIYSLQPITGEQSPLNRLYY
ncbi:DUF3298 and DUF4163 domain-containing protein [Paenibacillus sp. SC116]|uniref:DUF3298 and DUF4163 domain-containing protein n=1 Tax=Paenibacillus sp. SC116 TaxID=2968986 RepID=UPI00215B50A3|nr:DUF3298 and DUF4163 domain-containing protein [Paenibacillus sp. SC116]MCR8842771.1 DUF3298 and DUF4163 domain-containing protein [Paenibacillus sp. SC116]